MQTIVECVPNFSEGRDTAKVEAIAEALLAGPDVYLLDRDLDADHNRSVITIVGTRESIGEAALRGIGKAAELIDLRRHLGAHPRIGATDVVPFVPVVGVSLDDCVGIAQWVAEETWRRFRIPTYLYEAAARKPERRNLENVRRGQFEGLREELRTNPDRRPDFGEASLHPTAGATVVGARRFLIAYNINLNTPDVTVAKQIARKIRTSSGGFPCVKAMGVELTARNLTQVSLNLTDFETTSIKTVFDAVSREAVARDVTVASSEIVGLVPRQALEAVAVDYLKLEDFRPELIFENRLARIVEEHVSRSVRPAPLALRAQAESFVEAVGAATPTPGGGSASAFTGALAAALGQMVAGLTLNRKAYAAHHAALEQALRRLTELREKLMANIDRDAQSYEAVLRATRLPKATGAEQAERARAIEDASKHAAVVPLETAELAAQVGALLNSLRDITLPAAASDLVVASHLAEAARRGADENVRANLPSIQEQQWVKQVEARLADLARGSS